MILPFANYILVFIGSINFSSSELAVNSEISYFLYFSRHMCVIKQKHLPTFIDKCFVSNVIRLGFEPRTHSLEGCCSIQLSYPTLLVQIQAAKIRQF